MSNTLKELKEKLQKDITTYQSYYDLAYENEDVDGCRKNMVQRDECRRILTELKQINDTEEILSRLSAEQYEIFISGLSSVNGYGAPYIHQTEPIVENVRKITEYQKENFTKLLAEFWIKECGK